MIYLLTRDSECGLWSGWPVPLSGLAGGPPSESCACLSMHASLQYMLLGRAGFLHTMQVVFEVNSFVIAGCGVLTPALSFANV